MLLRLGPAAWRGCVGVTACFAECGACGVTKINWNGSQSAWRAKPAQSDRELLGQTLSKGAWPSRANYLTLAVAFVAVAAGSAGATLLASSLLSADVPELSSGVAGVAVPEVKAAAPIVADAPIAQKPSETAQMATLAAASQDETPGPAASVAATAPVVEEAAREEDVVALRSSDPRWAQFEKPAPPLDELRNDVQPGEAAAFDAAGKSGGAVAAVNRAIEEPDEELGQDSQETAAIAPPLRREEPNAAAGGRQIVLTTAANVRSRANKTGRVLGAVPAGVKITSYGCRSSWCEVSYKGLRGWVYAGFVSGNGQKPASSSRQKASSADAPRQKLQVTPSAATQGGNGGLPGVKANDPLPAIPRLDKSGK